MTQSHIFVCEKQQKDDLTACFFAGMFDRNLSLKYFFMTGTIAGSDRYVRVLSAKSENHLSSHRAIDNLI